MRGLTLRAADMGDASALFAWHNDPATRQSSLTTVQVSWESHLKCLEAALDNSKRRILIAQLRGERVGTVRIDFDEEVELSWNVSPDHRGKGIGKVMVRMGAPNERTIAKIKRENVASQRIAASVGFQLLHDADLQIWVRDATGVR
jgi:RimJ/RimL family protein N-acetyltransferase